MERKHFAKRRDVFVTEVRFDPGNLCAIICKAVSFPLLSRESNQRTDNLQYLYICKFQEKIDLTGSKGLV